MIQTQAPAVRLEYGLYRDGDNNLDEVQSATIAQAFAASDEDGAIHFSVEDTTARAGTLPSHTLRTESYEVQGGQPDQLRIAPPKDMSARATLAEFVTHALDEAQTHGAQATWIELVDHGGGDAGGLESARSGGFMSEDDIAGAIADGVARHAQLHPEDAQRRVDGVVANQCLMSTLGFADSLSHAGVRYLAASPEVMLAPGVPTGVAGAIEQHLDDPQALARAVTAQTMRERYGVPGDSFGPAAAFNMLDLDPQKIARMETAVKTLNDTIAHAVKEDGVRAEIRSDAHDVPGMARFTNHTMPWHADRPALAVYQALAQDEQLPGDVRKAATEAHSAVGALVLAHRESRDFAPYGDASYRNAVGPTVHFPVTHGQIDAWKPEVSETNTTFYAAVDGAKLARAIA